MKNIFLYAYILFFTCSCYDDKGNYDYHELEEIKISLPQESYNQHFNERLQINNIKIETTIPENDLSYHWQVLGDTLGARWKQYISIAEGKELDYVFEKDELLFPQEGTYQLRLNVMQISSGRHFYSNVVELTLVEQISLCGALVLHGDETSTDIGIIVAKEFQLTAPSATLKEQVLPHYYSEANGGEKITGKGLQILQNYSSNGQSYPDYIVNIVLTDQSSVVTNGKTMQKTGEFNDLFVGNLNQGKPEFCQLISDELYVIDGGDIFIKASNRPSFTVPLFTAKDYQCDFYPHIWQPEQTTLMRGLFFDRATRGFVGLSYMSMSNFNHFFSINAEEGGNGTSPFNPADMQAELLYMDAGGVANHFLAVMQEDNGNYFIAEIDAAAESNAKVPQYKYSLSHILDVQSGSVINWAFGSSFINMCYYATASGVYQFTADAGQTITPQPLRKQSGEEVKFEDEITLLRILKPNIGNGYYMSNIEMVVTTYGGIPGSGKLYSMELDPFSGRVISVKEYKGFDRIYDINIKGY
ncbi:MULTISPECIES: PKD-like family lipoprotein [Butyricimonas]|uniref:PKD-like family lipoprotein n=1 Tax=Butyricimonas TaxID=574697 RepID=UPI0007FB2AD9|nr:MULTISPECIES: PKD-like family lipoprotein [Butyricimonas]